MKKNIILKIILTIFLLTLISFICIQTVQGFDWKGQMTEFEGVQAGNSSNTVTGIMGALINIVSVIAAGIAIIMLIVMGVGYVTQGAEGKADFKKGLPTYIAGAVILFAASGILKLVQVFIDGNVNSI